MAVAGFGGAEFLQRGSSPGAARSRALVELVSCLLAPGGLGACTDDPAATSAQPSSGGAAGQAGAFAGGSSGAGATSGAGGGGASAAGSGGTSGGAGGGGPRLVAPADFDCSASAAPERSSPAPVSCLLDPACDEPLVSAHRGAGAPGDLAPEDTLSAFRAAIAVGADFTECDVRISADGVPVVIHDDSLDRTTEASGAVSELSLAELQAAPLKTSLYQGDFGCERIPTFGEVLELVKGRIVLIVDGSKTDRTDLIVQAVADADAFDWVVYDDTDVDGVVAARALDSRLAVALRATSQAELDERLPRISGAPPSWIHLEGAPPEQLVPLLEPLGQRAFTLGFGTDTAVSLTGNLADYQALYDSGVRIIQSNRPELLAEHLGRSRLAP